GEQHPAQRTLPARPPVNQGMAQRPEILVLQEGGHVEVRVGLRQAVIARALSQAFQEQDVVTVESVEITDDEIIFQLRGKLPSR
ncbi:MAG: hypothetical protein ACK2UW_09880, partial [Anaerolineales bacterium]